MKLRELIELVDKSKGNESYITLSTLAEQQMDIVGVDDLTDSNRLKAYFLSAWCCTDTWVGLRAYFLDDEFVAVSTQDGRKCDEVFTWKNDASYHEVRNYLLSLVAGTAPSYDVLTKDDMDEELDIGFSIPYTPRLIDNEVYYKGDLCPVVGNQHTLNNGDCLGTDLKIGYQGEEIIVDVVDTLVPWHIVKSN